METRVHVYSRNRVERLVSKMFLHNFQNQKWRGEKVVNQIKCLTHGAVSLEWQMKQK